MNYAKAHGWLQGSLECLVESIEVKILCEYDGEVKIPEEVIDELKAQISKMIKRSEEVGNEPSEFMDIPKKEEEEEVAKHNAEDDADDDRDFYLKEYDASDPTCNLPVPEYDSRDCV
tara:strand:- start:2350 stop:2700 length:351 start_codon:yes stop_codon:yes gene_type:complete